MQIFGNSSLFGSGHVHGLLGALFQTQGAATGQTSPTGDDAQASSTASSLTTQAPGQQFATATLASLLSLQEQPQSSQASHLASSIVSQFDKDGDGALGASDIEAALGLNGSDATTGSQVQSAIAKLDANGDGKLDAGELASGLTQLAQTGGRHRGHHNGGSSAGLAARMIGVGDSNGDGQLSVSEISSALSSAGLTMSSADLSAAVAKLDTNGDGELSASELTTAIESLRRQAFGGTQTASAASSTTAS